MNVLLLTPQLPFPPHQGTTLRNFHIIKGVAEKHQLTLLSFCEDDEADFGPLVDLCHEIVTIPTPTRTLTTRLLQMLTSRQPDMAHRLDSVSFKLALDQLLTENEFDIVQIEGLELAWALEIVRDISPSSKIVFDNHNAETALQRTAFQTDLRNPKRWLAAAYSWVQIGRLAHFEQWACESADAVTVVSDLDKEELRITNYGLRITVIPNCIDTSKYESPTDPIPHDIIFMGKMDYRPNIDAVLWFANEILPRIRQQCPTATFAIVGQKPHPRLDHLRGQDGIVVTGWVESVLPYLHGAQVVVLPLRMGSGTRLKVIEAMAASKPIVSTILGVSGFPVIDGEHCLLADEPHQFAMAVVDLLKNQTKAAQLAHNAHTFAQQYDWHVITPRFNQLYENLAIA